MANFKPSNSSDELNPNFLLSMTATELLVGIANGQIDVQELAKQQLANRGLNLEGKWVGFSKAQASNK